VIGDEDDDHDCLIWS